MYKFRKIFLVSLFMAFIIPVLSFVLLFIPFLGEGVWHLSYFFLAYVFNFFGPFDIWVTSPMLALGALAMHLGIFFLLSLGISYSYAHFRKQDSDPSFSQLSIIVFLGILVIAFIIGLISYSLLI